MKVIAVEPTPNPDALKFIVDTTLLNDGVRAYDHQDEAKDDVLATTLFTQDGVKSVFYMDKFVTVSKNLDVSWPPLQKAVQQIIEEKAQAAPEKPQPQTSAGTSFGDVLDQINQVLNENVLPALANDGGSLKVLSFKDFNLKIHYQGACGSCPSAQAGTLFSIQNLLQSMVDPRIQVTADS